MSVRIGIAGLGAAARHIHLPAYRKLPGVEIVGACDPARPPAPAGLPVHARLEELVAAERPDVLVIATPTPTHHALARTALELGLHVLVEKPFASTLDEAVELVELARRRGRRLAVNNEFRFMACHAAARGLVGQPAFGELLFAHLHQSFRTSAESEAGWRGASDERTCVEFGTHVFDLCRFFFGTEPLRLRAIMPRPTGGPDMLNLVDVEFPGDRWARVTLDRLTRGRHRYLDVRLDGTRAAVETELGGHVEFAVGLNAPARRPFVRADLSLGGRALLCEGESRRCIARDPLDLFAAATRELMRAFVAAIASDRDPPCSGSDNLRTFAMMRAAYESAASGRDVDLAYLRDLP